MSTNSVVSVAELKVKTAGFGKSIKIKPHLSQSKSFLKILEVSYWDSNSSLPITFAQVAEALSNYFLFESVILASMLCIMKASPSSDMSVIWINIWNSQKGSKGKIFINHSFNIRCHNAIVIRTAIHPGISQYHNCWYREHYTHVCCAQGTKYQKCGGLHRVENHRLLA